MNCGLSNKLDGSENDLTNINGLEDYRMPGPGGTIYLNNNRHNDSTDQEDGEEQISIPLHESIPIDDIVRF